MDSKLCHRFTILQKIHAEVSMNLDTALRVNRGILNQIHNSNQNSYLRTFLEFRTEISGPRDAHDKLYDRFNNYKNLHQQRKRRCIFPLGENNYEF